MRSIKVSYDLEVRKYDEDDNEIELSAEDLHAVAEDIRSDMAEMVNSDWSVNLDLLNLKVELDEDAS
jgi:hypothetical protein